MSPIEDRAAEHRAADAGRVPSVINLASRMKAEHSRRRPRISSPSRIYVFPSRNTRVMRTSRDTRHVRASPAMRLHTVDPPAQASAGMQKSALRRRTSTRLPVWIRPLTTRRALVIGAIACYALIMFNLIYGIAALARLKSLRPLPAVSAAEPQRPLAAVTAAVVPPPTFNIVNSFAETGVRGPCTFDAAFEGTRRDVRRHAGIC